MFHTISSKTVIPEIHNRTKGFHTIKTELNNTKKELVKAQQDIVSLKTETKSLAEELNTVKETTNNILNTGSITIGMLDVKMLYCLEFRRILILCNILG